MPKLALHAPQSTSASPNHSAVIADKDLPASYPGQLSISPAFGLRLGALNRDCKRDAPKPCISTDESQDFSIVFIWGFVEWFSSLPSAHDTMKHHLMIGTWTPPGVIITVEFDDETLSLKLVKKTEIPEDEPISWMTFDVSLRLD